MSKKNKKDFPKEKSDLRGAEASASFRQGCVLTAHGDPQHITSALRRQEYLRDYNIMLGILYIHRFRALGFLQFVLEHSHDYDSIVSLLIHTQYIQLTWSSWWNIDHFHFLPGLPSFHCHVPFCLLFATCCSSVAVLCPVAHLQQHRAVWYFQPPSKSGKTPQHNLYIKKESDKYKYFLKSQLKKRAYSLQSKNMNTIRLCSYLS